MRDKEELMQYVSEWLILNEKMRKINKYLYEHTELFENSYELEFEQDLWSFFAGKITRFTKDYNEIIKRMNKKELSIWNRIKLIGR